MRIAADHKDRVRALKTSGAGMTGIALGLVSMFSPGKTNDLKTDKPNILWAICGVRGVLWDQKTKNSSLTNTFSVACEGFDSPTKPHPQCAVVQTKKYREGALRLTAQRGPTSGFSSSTRYRNRTTPHDEACGESFYLGGM